MPWRLYFRNGFGRWRGYCGSVRRRGVPARFALLLLALLAGILVLASTLQSISGLAGH
jgi:hypothetical protein